MQKYAINKYKSNPLEHKGYLIKSLADVAEHGGGINELRYYIKLLSNPELMDDFILFANTEAGLNHRNCDMDQFYTTIRQYRKTKKLPNIIS